MHALINSRNAPFNIEEENLAGVLWGYLKWEIISNLQEQIREICKYGEMGKEQAVP